MSSAFAARAARITLLVCITATGIGTAPAAAAPIAEWDLASATGQSAGVLSTAANVTASSMTASPALTQWASTAQDGFIAAADWAAGATADPTRYYEWTVTAAPGFSIGYETLTLALFRGIQGGLHGAQLWDLRASTDGFASSSLLLQTFDISATAADTQTVFAGVDISAIGVTVGTVTFRLYGYDYTSAADYSGLGNDSGWLIYGTGTNPVVEGTVAIATPEPGAGALLALGLALLGIRRRAASSPH